MDRESLKIPMFPMGFPHCNRFTSYHATSLLNEKVLKGQLSKKQTTKTPKNKQKQTKNKAKQNKTKQKKKKKRRKNYFCLDYRADIVGIFCSNTLFDNCPFVRFRGTSPITLKHRARRYTEWQSCVCWPSDTRLLR